MTTIQWVPVIRAKDGENDEYFATKWYGEESMPSRPWLCETRKVALMRAKDAMRLRWGSPGHPKGDSHHYADAVPFEVTQAQEPCGLMGSVSRRVHITIVAA
jgi:hypothetical protein